MSEAAEEFRLLAGEEYSSAGLDARHWVRVYKELVEFCEQQGLTWACQDSSPRSFVVSIASKSTVSYARVRPSSSSMSGTPEQSAGRWQATGGMARSKPGRQKPGGK